MFKSRQIFLVLALGTVTINSFAESNHVVIATNCLLNKVSFSYKKLAADSELSLIKINHAKLHALIATKSQQTSNTCGGFMDVTETWKKSPALSAQTFLTSYAAPKTKHNLQTRYDIKYTEQVNQLLSALNPQDMWSDLKKLSAYRNRNAETQVGLNVVTSLKKQIDELAKDNNRTDVSSYLIDTPNYLQKSLVVKIGESNKPGIVIGSHIDTTYNFLPDPIQPGADDNGTGSVTTLEIVRLLLNSGMQFKNPIYFIWYAAEEEGMKGSQAVVEYFTQHKIPVAAALNLDMTGFAYLDDPTIYLVTDHVDSDLTAYLQTLTTTYVNVPIDFTKCGYACSDHVSWNNVGVSVALPFEAAFEHYNHKSHTEQDRMNILSLEHMTSFAKLGVAFVVEMAEPVN